MQRLASLVLITLLSTSAAARAGDPVLDWIQAMNDAVLAGGTTPLVTTRNSALVGAAIYDAVNGIEKRYTRLIVPKYTGPHASARAAAIQSAYTMLVLLYPAQKGTFDTRLAASLAEISTGHGAERAAAIAYGRGYGDAVANTIFNERSSDGFNPPPPPFLGADQTGVWRPTAAGATGASPQFATLTPWVLTRPSQFRLPPPLALASAEYAADYNEVKTYGTITGGPGDADRTDTARFWNGNTALYWNRIASQIVAGRDLSLVETARVFGLLNVAMMDAGVACWDGKYRYVYWRPVTAIQHGDADGNPATEMSATWTPRLPVTPSHPEYPSGHSTVSGAAAAVLAALFGDDNVFTVGSEITGTEREFTSFSSALAQIHDARVFGGIHFRTACRLGSVLGAAVAEWVMTTSMHLRRSQ